MKTLGYLLLVIFSIAIIILSMVMASMPIFILGLGLFLFYFIMMNLENRKSMDKAKSKVVSDGIKMANQKEQKQKENEIYQEEKLRMKIRKQLLEEEKNEK